MHSEWFYRTSRPVFRKMWLMLILETVVWSLVLLDPSQIPRLSRFYHLQCENNRLRFFLHSVLSEKEWVFLVEWANWLWVLANWIHYQITSTLELNEEIHSLFTDQVLHLREISDRWVHIQTMQPFVQSRQHMTCTKNEALHALGKLQSVLWSRQTCIISTVHCWSGLQCLSWIHNQKPVVCNSPW